MNAAKFVATATAVGFGLMTGSPAFAQKKYDVGASDTEIKIGNTVAYSGPVSSLGVVARIEAAYFRKINDEGGVNGRKGRVRFVRRRIQPTQSR